MALTKKGGQGLDGENQLFTPIQVQKAKDFIWEHIDKINREQIVHQMTKVEQGTNTLSIKSVTIGYQYH